jgi:hypothetical protein
MYASASMSLFSVWGMDFMLRLFVNKGLSLKDAVRTDMNYRWCRYSLALSSRVTDFRRAEVLYTGESSLFGGS